LAKTESNHEQPDLAVQPARPGGWFTGTVRIDPLFDTPVPARAAGASVTFEPGARTAWHTHPLGQMLIVTSGLGRAQRWGGPIEEIRPGDVVWSRHRDVFSDAGLMSVTRTIPIVLFLVALGPGAARADGLIVPYVGVNFGGDSGTDLGAAVDAKQSNFGVSFAWMGGGVIGFEGDVGYSPDFFGKTDAGGSSMLTLAGNVLLGVPIGGQTGFGVRPYGLVGIAAVQPSGDAFAGEEVFGDTRVAWDFGGGLLVFFASHVGIRADVRYFRTFEAADFFDTDLSANDAVGNLDFTRGSLGFVLRF
jgi:hypothetical protein